MKIYLKSWDNVQDLINTRKDVITHDGHVFPFVRFVNLPLIDVHGILEDGTWYFEI